MGFFDFLKNKPNEKTEPAITNTPVKESVNVNFENNMNKAEQSIGDMMHELDELIAEIDNQIAERDSKENPSKE